MLRKFQSKDALVGKLFAKHIKLKEAIKFLEHAKSVVQRYYVSFKVLTNSRIGIGVGTPSRIIDLLNSGRLLLISMICDCLTRMIRRSVEYCASSSGH